MQATFELSGFQFTAGEGDTLQVPLQAAEVGSAFDIADVLLVAGGKTTLVGTPTIDGAKIEAELVANGKSDKVIVFKKKRRTKYRRTRGHVQDYSEIKIKKIVVPS